MMTMKEKHTDQPSIIEHSDALELFIIVRKYPSVFIIVANMNSKCVKRNKLRVTIEQTV